MDLTTVAGTELRRTASYTWPSSPTALAQRPAPAPLHAPQQDVAATETPTQSNTSRLHQSLTSYLNDVVRRAPAAQIKDIAVRHARHDLQNQPSRIIDLAAGMRDRARVTGRRHRKEIQDITAPLGVRAERVTFEIDCPLGTGPRRVLRCQCPSSSSPAKLTTLLVEAAPAQVRTRIRASERAPCPSRARRLTPPCSEPTLRSPPVVKIRPWQCMYKLRVHTCV